MWKYFAPECDEQGHCKSHDTVICRLCSNDVKVKGGNTGNLKSHLCVHHPLRYAELRKRVQDEKAKKDKASKLTDKG